MAYCKVNTQRSRTYETSLTSVRKHLEFYCSMLTDLVIEVKALREGGSKYSKTWQGSQASVVLPYLLNQHNNKHLNPQPTGQYVFPLYLFILFPSNTRGSTGFSPINRHASLQVCVSKNALIPLDPRSVRPKSYLCINPYCGTTTACIYISLFLAKLEKPASILSLQGP